jgi:iron complex transport system ATP-binding protein
MEISRLKIQVKDLEFGYGTSRILSNICFDVFPSELVAVMGPNGVGKSTLIRCMDKILTPDHGSVVVDQRDLSTIKIEELPSIIGYVPQRSTMMFPIKVFDVVLMGRRPNLQWRDSDIDIRKSYEIMEKMGVTHLAMRDFNHLSGGEQQKVLIARALAQDADILFLDEPTSNLDIKHQHELLHILRNLVRNEKKTVVMIVHDLNLAAKYSDRIILLKNGRVFRIGVPEEVLIPENIKDVYEVNVEIHMHNNTPNIIVN